MRQILAAAATAAALALPMIALAAPPQAGGQAPGWFRMQLGTFEVTALNDGIFQLPVDKLLSSTGPLDGINEAFDRLDRGEVIRHVITMAA